MLSTFLLVILAGTVPANPIDSPYKTCTTNSECPSTQCCLLTPIRYGIPSCRTFQQKGEQCRVNADTITTTLSYPDKSQLEIKNVHYILCSCANGLSCNHGICE
ncbi:hypothetical protein ACFW04_010426 [Cataglyphis niger]